MLLVYKTSAGQKGNRHPHMHACTYLQLLHAGMDAQVKGRLLRRFITTTLNSPTNSLFAALIEALTRLQRPQLEPP